MFDKKLESRRLFVLIVIFSSIALKFLLIDKFVYWQDEAYTYWFASQSFKDLIFWVPTFDANPPFYYILLKFWNIFFADLLNYSERYLSLFLLLPIYYFSIKAVLLFNGKAFVPVLFFVVMISLNPLLSWYAIEARAYMLMACCYSITIYSFLRILQSNTADKKAWIYITIGAILLNWTHSTGSLQSLFIFSILSLHIIFFKRADIKFLLSSLIVVFVFSLPLALMVYQQLLVWSDSTWIQEPSFRSLFYLLRDSFIFFRAENLYFEIFDKSFLHEKIVFALKISTLPIVGLCLYLVVKEKRAALLYLAIITFAIPIIYYLISVIGPNILLGRTLIGLQISYYIFIVVTLSFVKNRMTFFMVLSFILLQILASNVDLNKYRTKEPWVEVYRYIEENTKRGEKVLLLPNAVFMPLAHLAGDDFNKLNIFKLPYDFPAIEKSNYYPAGMPSVPGITLKDIPQILKVVNEDDNGFLLITRAEALFDPNKLLVRSFVESSFALEDKKEFKNISLYKFKKLQNSF